MININHRKTLDKADINLKPVGALWNETENSTTFRVWVPYAASVEIEIENRYKTYSLQPEGLGYWSIELTEASPGDKYFVKVDGKVGRPDPASRRQPEGVHGPSEIIDPRFGWPDQQWKGIPLAEMIIYELHVGTFTQEGTFEGVASRLDYLKDLGVNTLEIMPIAQFPGDRNWGYDGVYPFAVQNSYGRPEDLKRLIDKCHEKQMAIVLDVVYNHLGPEGNYLEHFGPYFTQKYKTPWGKAVNFDDTYSDGVRSYFLHNAIMWLDEYHFDGLRLDAVHAIYDFGAMHIMKALHEQTVQLEGKNKRQYVLIAESDLNDVRYISSTDKGGYGLSGQWCDDFHHSLHTLVTRENEGYYEDFGSVDHLAKSLKHSFVYNGSYSPSRKRIYGNNADQNPYSQFVVCAQNHDQVGNRLAGDRLTQNISFEKLKLTATVLLLSPHVPMLFMGEEYGEKNPFQYFISHGDPSLIEAVRKGRKEEFASFNWEGKVPDPQDPSTFVESRLNWQERDAKQNALFDLYKFLIHFRKSHKLAHIHRSSVGVFPNADQNLLAITLTLKEKEIRMVYNFGDEEQLYPFATPGASFSKALDSSDEQWLGPGTRSPSQLAENSQVIVNKESALIFEFKI